MASRRDRHGRGLRGALAPPAVPIAHTPAEAFDEAVLDAAEHLEAHGITEVSGIEFAVDDVPEIGAGEPAYDSDVLEDGGVPLARAYPTGLDEVAKPVVVLYRRPLENRAPDPEDLADLVHDVVVDRVAHLLGRDPDDLDPHRDD